jgi:hypothetical protein
MPEAPKPFYLSKTFWSNVILGVIVVMLPEPAKVYFTADNVAYLFAGVNMLLRLISKGAVELW